MIQSEALEFGKTQFLHEIVSPFGNDKLVFLTPFDTDPNFVKASNALKNISIANPQQFNISHMLKNDLIFATKEGLMQLEEILESRQKNYFRNRSIPREELPYDKYLHKKESKKFAEWGQIIKPTLEDEEFQARLQEPGAELEIFTPSLQHYLEDLKAHNETSRGKEE